MERALRNFLIGSASVNTSLYFLMRKEINSLPSVASTIQFITKSNIKQGTVLILLGGLLILVPISTITFILSFCKKFTFDSYKPIKKCYKGAFKLLLACYMLCIWMVLTEFLTKMAHDPDEYLIVMSYSILEGHPYRYSIVSRALNAILFQACIFLVFFMLIEMAIAYRKFISSHRLSNFGRKMIPCFLIVIMIGGIYFSVMVKLVGIGAQLKREGDGYMASDGLEYFDSGFFVGILSVYYYYRMVLP